jgi:hypothetical protein
MVTDEGFFFLYIVGYGLCGSESCARDDLEGCCVALSLDVLQAGPLLPVVGHLLPASP